MAEDELARERSKMKEKIAAEEDKIIDTTMYRIWFVNQDIGISFMEDAQESILAKWKARLEE